MHVFFDKSSSRSRGADRASVIEDIIAKKESRYMHVFFDKSSLWGWGTDLDSAILDTISKTGMGNGDYEVEFLEKGLCTFTNETTEDQETLFHLELEEGLYDLFTGKLQADAAMYLFDLRVWLLKHPYCDWAHFPKLKTLQVSS